MRLRYKQVKKYRVKTVSGFDLGNVVDIVFDTQTHGIMQYDVRTIFSRKTYSISITQVVRFDAGVIIVDDAAIPKEIASRTKKQSPRMRPKSATMREDI